MGPSFLDAFLRTSSSELNPPTSNSDLDGSANAPREHSAQPTSSPVDSHTENQLPNDGIFWIYCARIELGSGQYLSQYKKSQRRLKLKKKTKTETRESKNYQPSRLSLARKHGSRNL